MTAIANSDIQVAADEVGVCRRPFLRMVTDRATGVATSIPIPCGSTRERICPACARKAQRLRIQQCREGWHLADDPLPDEPEPAEGDAEDRSEHDEQERRIRSTRRISGFPGLPKVAIEHCSVGRTFTDERTGRTFRPSMFVTLTLPSYGRVDPVGCPRQPDQYDYRRAALDAMFFARLADRWWQNLRRCAGYKVQYFAAVEPQRRLAPHLHCALRGAIPRSLIRRVTEATYCAIWWPSIDVVAFDEGRGDRMPVWDEWTHSYVDPATGAFLPTWEEALLDLDRDPEARPFHVLRFGKQLDVQGLIGDSLETDRAVGYLCKYLTKSIAETYDDPASAKNRRASHIDRLHDELRWIPCSESCANWLRFGISPKDPEPGLCPGHCQSKAHDRHHLGIGGRRVLVSRFWTGKTLTEHRADRATVVREVLEEAGMNVEDARRMAADVLHEDGRPRFIWEDIPPEHRDYARAIANSVRRRRAWRAQYEQAKKAIAARPPPQGGCG